jgi:hypothetical protein
MVVALYARVCLMEVVLYEKSHELETVDLDLGFAPWKKIRSLRERCLGYSPLSLLKELRPIQRTSLLVEVEEEPSFLQMV